jgi:hypothetical protein
MLYCHHFFTSADPIENPKIVLLCSEPIQTSHLDALTHGQLAVPLACCCIGQAHVAVRIPLGPLQHAIFAGAYHARAHYGRLLALFQTVDSSITLHAFQLCEIIQTVERDGIHLVALLRRSNIRPF